MRLHPLPARTILLAIIAITAALSQAACGDEAGQTEKTAPADTAAATVARTTPPADPNAPITLNPAPPSQPVRLVFVHHSVGEDWLMDDKGGLGRALTQNNYSVSDTNYGWGPVDKDVGDERIGDHTDIGQWYNWFAGPNSATYLKALYSTDGVNTSSTYEHMSNMGPGENEVIMFKSCFPNSLLAGGPDDPPAFGDNPLRGEGSGSEYQTVANAKGIYMDLLKYFETRQDKLFIVVTAPPNVEGEASPEQAANARAFNRWLVDDWLADYPYRNVAVFDFYNVLTSNGGSPEISDAGTGNGNHHRYNASLDAVEYTTGRGGDFAAYGTGSDSHPTASGLKKATEEFVTLLNVEYNAWKGL